jgi:hypothetical protein
MHLSATDPFRIEHTVGSTGFEGIEMLEVIGFRGSASSMPEPPDFPAVHLFQEGEKSGQVKG